MCQSKIFKKPLLLPWLLVLHSLEMSLKNNTMLQMVRSSSDEGPLQSTFNFDFSAMKLFAQSRLLEKSKGVTTVQHKKRPYDNSKRSEKSSWN